jgi:hypothetical protein
MRYTRPTHPVDDTFSGWPMCLGGGSRGRVVARPEHDWRLGQWVIFRRGILRNPGRKALASRDDDRRFS